MPKSTLISVAQRISNINLASKFNAKVHLDIGGATLTSVITMDALHDLKLSVGDSAYAIFKASSVILGIE